MPARFAHVSHHVYRGGEPTPDDIDVLKKCWNIQKIVSLDANVGVNIDNYCKKIGVEHVIIPLTHGFHENVDKIPDEIMSWKDNYIYVHCLHGRDRTSMVCAMYRVLVDHWSLEEALEEAETFKMGHALAPEIKNSYYQAVTEFYNLITKDKNKADDIVTLQRDTQNFSNPAPAANNYNNNAFTQQSFAPFGDSDYRANIKAKRILMLQKIAETINVYKYCTLKEIFSGDKHWYASVSEAFKHADAKSNKCYSFSIPSIAKIKEFNQEPESTLIEQATLDGADVAKFKTNPPQYVIINQNIIENIKSVGPDENDSQDIPMIGELQDYKGSTIYPDNGSVPGGAGGVTGLIKLPGAIPFGEV